MRYRTLQTWTLLTALAGCLSDEPAPQAPGAETDEAPSADHGIPIELRQCSYVEILARVDPAAARALLPGDFELQLSPEGQALVLLGGANCQTAASKNRTEPASFAWTSLIIQAPKANNLRGENVAVFLYRLEHMTRGDLYARVAEEAGAERIPLQVLIADVRLPNASLELAAPGFGRHIDAPAAPPQPGEPGRTRWREFGAVPGGYAMLEATLVPDANAGTLPGVVRTTGSSVARRVLGETAAGLVAYGTDYSVLEGSMRVIRA